jgi:hypothetical protein
MLPMTASAAPTAPSRYVLIPATRTETGPHAAKIRRYRLARAALQAQRTPGIREHDALKRMHD